ncbi:MAG: hypothetical protein Q9178_007497 [Gyalolechia marmorata]
MLSSTPLFLSLFPLALSNPLAPRNHEPIQFELIAARSTTPIHLQAINANGQAFYIGKETATFCPLVPESQCPPGNLTVFSTFDGTASLNTAVPGGQQIFVAPNGKLSYTQAHSGYIPPGSALKTFTTMLSTEEGTPGTFFFEGLGGGDFLACPSDKVGSENGPFPYKIFVDVPALSDADVPSGCVDDCLGFVALVAPYEGGAAAWEYT